MGIARFTPYLRTNLVRNDQVTAMQPATLAQPTVNPQPAVAEVPLQMVMMQMATGYWVAQSIYAAAKLGIADYLREGAQLCTELAMMTGSDERSLYRLLRALASVGIFAETDPGWFGLTPMAMLLQRDVPGSIRDIAIMLGDTEHYGSWGNILHSIQTGGSAFEDLFGTNIFQYYAQNPQPAAVFDKAMTGFSEVEGAAVAEAYDFSEIHCLADIAGGQGHLLTTILQANPHMTGILFDQPAVIEGARSILVASGVGDRCQTVAGSFFEPVPSGADAYILKHIVHDWDDQRAITILRQCHQAMPDHGKLLIVEQIVPDGNEPSMSKFLDLNMLVMCPGGKERTVGEYEALFAAAGFKLNRIVPTTQIVSVIEGVKV